MSTILYFTYINFKKQIIKDNGTYISSLCTILFKYISRYIYKQLIYNWNILSYNLPFLSETVERPIYNFVLKSICSLPLMLISLKVSIQSFSRSSVKRDTRSLSISNILSETPGSKSTPFSLLLSVRSEDKGIPCLNISLQPLLPQDNFNLRPFLRVS